MSNSNLTALNDHLFDQLERLSDPTKTPSQIALEIEKSKAMSGIASQIIGSAKVTIDAMKLVASSDYNMSQLPEMIGTKIPKNE